MAERDKGLSTGEMAAVGVAGASPFAGMIGQERLKHDPTRGAKMQHFQDMEELSRRARPGDIILTSKAKSSYKKPQSWMFGSEYYHAQPVVGRRGDHGTTVSAGDYPEKKYKRMSPQAFGRKIETVKDMMAGEAYTDAVLLRPKRKLTPVELERFVASTIDRSKAKYTKTRAVSAYVKDVFLPKLIPAGLLNRHGGITPTCVGDVCSTAPAQALTSATGRSVVRGKAAKDVMPADFLRSEHFKPVGKVGTGARRVSALRPLALRAGLGAGLAGLTYGVMRAAKAISGRKDASSG